MKLLHTFFILLIAILGAVNTYAQDQATSYGDLYLIDELQPQNHTFKLGLEYSNETSNTFQNINEAVLSLDYMPLQYLSIGLQGSLADNSDRSLSNSIREKLAESGYRQQFYNPKNTYLGFVGLRTLSGRLNFFQVSTIPFEMWLRLGYGRVLYDQPKVDYEISAWQLNVNSYFYKNMGLQVGVGQEIENLFEDNDNKLAKFKVRVGWLVKF